jgi:hypothetical protein
MILTAATSVPFLIRFGSDLLAGRHRRGKSTDYRIKQLYAIKNIKTPQINVGSGNS